jgi:hypothetical protein
MKFRFASVAAACMLALTSVSAEAAAPTAIQFAKGKSGATVTGKLVGGDDVDYTLRASAGQTMTVDFKAGKGAAYFNVIPPGSSGEALFVGMNEGSNHYEGQLPADGTYTIRLYLMGAAKDSGKPVNYSLKVGVKGGSTAAKASGGGSPAEKACLAAVVKATGVSVGKLSISSVSEAQSGISIMVKAPEATAPWHCLSDKNGKVDGVEFTGSEGGN